MATITGSNSTAVSGTARTLVRRLTGIVVAVAAMMIGFAVAGSASQAHADTVTGSTYFTSTVECGGDTLVFTTNSDADYGSYAQVWVWDSYTQEWVTDGNWVEADYYASYNIADLTFDPGYYLVYVAYAQWNGYDFDYSGEYIDTYDQYYSYDDHQAESFCYMGNALSTY
jgi:hypothetical protein